MADRLRGTKSPIFQNFLNKDPSKENSPSRITYEPLKGSITPDNDQIPPLRTDPSPPNLNSKPKTRQVFNSRPKTNRKPKRNINYSSSDSIKSSSRNSSSEDSFSVSKENQFKMNKRSSSVPMISHQPQLIYLPQQTNNPPFINMMQHPFQPQQVFHQPQQLQQHHHQPQQFRQPPQMINMPSAIHQNTVQPIFHNQRNINTPKRPPMVLQPNHIHKNDFDGIRIQPRAISAPKILNRPPNNQFIPQNRNETLRPTSASNRSVQTIRELPLTSPRTPIHQIRRTPSHSRSQSANRIVTRDYSPRPPTRRVVRHGKVENPIQFPPKVPTSPRKILFPESEKSLKEREDDLYQQIARSEEQTIKILERAENPFIDNQKTISKEKIQPNIIIRFPKPVFSTTINPAQNSKFFSDKNKISKNNYKNLLNTEFLKKKKLPQESNFEKEKQIEELRSSKAKLEARVAILQEKLNRSEAENKKLKESKENNLNSSSSSSSSNQTEKLRNKIFVLENKLKQKIQKKEEKSLSNSLKEKLNFELQKNKELKNALDKKEEELEEKNQELIELRLTLEQDLGDRISQMFKKAVSNAPKEEESNIKNKENKNLRNENAELRSALEKLQEELETAQELIKKLKENPLETSQLKIQNEDLRKELCAARSETPKLFGTKSLKRRATSKFGEETSEVLNEQMKKLIEDDESSSQEEDSQKLKELKFAESEYNNSKFDSQLESSSANFIKKNPHLEHVKKLSKFSESFGAGVRSFSEELEESNEEQKEIEGRDRFEDSFDEIQQNHQIEIAKAASKTELEDSDKLENEIGHSALHPAPQVLLSGSVEDLNNEETRRFATVVPEMVTSEANTRRATMNSHLENLELEKLKRENIQLKELIEKLQRELDQLKLKLKNSDGDKRKSVEQFFEEVKSYVTGESNPIIKEVSVNKEISFMPYRRREATKEEFEDSFEEEQYKAFAQIANQTTFNNPSAQKKDRKPKAVVSYENGLNRSQIGAMIEESSQSQRQSEKDSLFKIKKSEVGMNASHIGFNIPSNRASPHIPSNHASPPKEHLTNNDLTGESIVEKSFIGMPGRGSEPMNNFKFLSIQDNKEKQVDIDKELLEKVREEEKEKLRIKERATIREEEREKIREEERKKLRTEIDEDSIEPPEEEFFHSVPIRNTHNPMLIPKEDQEKPWKKKKFQEPKIELPDKRVETEGFVWKNDSNLNDYTSRNEPGLYERELDTSWAHLEFEKLQRDIEMFKAENKHLNDEIGVLRHNMEYEIEEIKLSPSRNSQRIDYSNRGTPRSKKNFLRKPEENNYFFKRNSYKNKEYESPITERIEQSSSFIQKITRSYLERDNVQTQRQNSPKYMESSNSDVRSHRNSKSLHIEIRSEINKPADIYTEQMDSFKNSFVARSSHFSDRENMPKIAEPYENVFKLKENHSNLRTELNELKMEQKNMKNQINDLQCEMSSITGESVSKATAENDIHLRDKFERGKKDATSLQFNNEEEELRKELEKAREDRDRYKEKLNTIRRKFLKKNKDFEGKLQSIEELKKNYKDKLDEVFTSRKSISFNDDSINR